MKSGDSYVDRIYELLNRAADFASMEVSAHYKVFLFVEFLGKPRYNRMNIKAKDLRRILNKLNEQER